MSLSIIRFRNTTIDHSIYDLCQRYANLAYYSLYDSKIPPQLSISCCLNNTRIVYNWVNHTTIAFLSIVNNNAVVLVLMLNQSYVAYDVVHSWASQLGYYNETNIISWLQVPYLLTVLSFLTGSEIKFNI